ncbi:hypothetical protein BGLA2_360015 [Burkholderia gladioli]|nr:hypothetical protein BGLA2_360015 [Burkholderia gladioli]
MFGGRHLLEKRRYRANAIHYKKARRRHNAITNGL